MNTQISRNSFNRDKRYSAIYQQMGRMLTDADWNEFADLNKTRLAEALTDIIGSGTPRERGIVQITDNGDGTTTDTLQWGYAYVDGVLAEVRPDPQATLSDPAGIAFEYLNQADFPDASAPAGDHLLYLDVWERTVTTLEDDKLRDAGLHGADTCTRSQTMAQVKWCPIDVEPENNDHNPRIGKACLSLSLREGSTEPDPCDPCANEIALQDKIGNYLFRVDIHDVQYDGFGNPNQVTLKWSRENGAEQYVIGDAPAGFDSDKWSYEFYSGAALNFASEKHLGKHLAAGFGPTRENLVKSYPGTPPAGTQLVRRWDGYCILSKNGSDWELVEGNDTGVDLSTDSASDAHAHIVNGASVTINLDAITLEIELADHALLAGDYWQAEVRQAIHVANSVLLSEEKPQGIKHHYMVLGQVTAGVFTAYNSPECRRFEFPPLTDIRADDVCYNNDACAMPGVDTVQEAIDHLCQTQDLRWHHKHLHGWGIVCGLIAECCDQHEAPPDEQPEVDPETGETEDDVNDLPRRAVCVTAGHALTCEGERVSLDQNLTVPVLDQIEALQEEGADILDEDGNGSVCLRLDPDTTGNPNVSVEAYDSSTHKQPMFDGTLLMDFYQHCILDLVEAIRGEFSFLDASELDEVEGGSTGLVSTQRRKLVSLLNLIVQLFNSGNGSYVFLSRKEHLILRDIYLGLSDLLRSKTFCAMFQDNQFPDYPFPDTGMTTYFGKNSHTRIKAHPSGESIYTYGGTDNTINVFEVATGELKSVIQMPSAEGAEVTAIAFSPDGQRLYATASVRQIDTVFGVARVNDDHGWQDMTILCDIIVTEMEVAIEDSNLIYALGKDRGLYFLRPDLFLDDTKPQPVPAYAFNAAGHMVLDQQNKMAYCTSQDKISEEGVYDEIVVCDLSSAGENQNPGTTMPLLGPTGAALQGEDGIAVRRPNADGSGGRLFIIIETNTNASTDKLLYTYPLPLPDGIPAPVSTLSIENTDIGLAYHHGQDRLLLAMEDGYRVQMFNQNGEADSTFRIPVQIQPVDLIVDEQTTNVYTLNFISNTVSLTPAAELQVNNAFLNDLAEYRTDILTAFYGLFGGILQYLKDCFCHHLLVKCPSCDDEVLYLATVEIRDNEVYKICNFDKRKYVKSFPTMGYWFSLVPFWPMLKSAVSSFCCSVLPDFFGQYQDALIGQSDNLPEGAQQEVQTNAIKAKTTRGGIQTYQRTDKRALIRDQGKSLQLGGILARDGAASFIQESQRNQAGVKKQSLINSSTEEAVIELNKNNIQVDRIEEYDSRKTNDYLVEYTRTPQRIQPGSEVTLIQKEGKVLYYSVKKPENALVADVPETLKIEIQELENRKAALSDLGSLKADLAEAETRKAGLAGVDETRAELEQIQAEKATVEAALAAIKSQVDDIKLVRAEEESKLAEISTQRASISADVESLNQSLVQLDAARKEIALEVEKQRPVSAIEEVDIRLQLEFRESGVLTVKDLADADADVLVSTTGGLTKEKATRLIQAANTRLNSDLK